MTTQKLKIELVVERSNDFSNTMLNRFWSRWIAMVNWLLEFVFGLSEFFPEDDSDSAEDQDKFIVNSKVRIVIDVESSEASLNLDVLALESIFETLKLVCRLYLKRQVGDFETILAKFVNVSLNRLDVRFDPEFKFRIIELKNPDDRLGNILTDLTNVGAKSMSYYAQRDANFLAQLHTFVSEGMKDVLSGFIKVVCGPHFYKGCVVVPTTETGQE